MTDLNLIGRLKRRFPPGGGFGLFAGQAFWSAVAALFGSATNVLLLLVVTRMLGVGPGGGFVLFQTTIVAVSSIVGWGLATAQTRGVAMCDNNAGEEHRLLRAGEILGAGAATIALILVAICAFWPGSVLPMSGAPVVLASAAAAVCGAVFDGIYKAHLTGQGRMRAVAAISLCGSVVAMGTMALAAGRYGVGGATAAVALSWLIQAGLGASLTHLDQRVPRGRTRVDICQLRGLVAVAIPATLAGIMVAPSHWLIQILLAATPGGYAKVALLGICLQWFNAATLAPASVGKVAMPMVARHLKRNDEHATRKFLIYSLALNGALTIPVAILVSAASHRLLGLYSSEFSDGTMAMVLAMVAATITALQVPFGNVIWARSRAWLAAAMNILWAACFVLGAVWFLPWGTPGVLVALSCAYAINLAVVAIMMRDDIRGKVGS
jgi:O-antigen/teichoic acid export membrane protein